MRPLLYGGVASVLREQGWGVPVPSSTETKAPLLPSWPSYHELDPLPEQIEIWAARWPDANTALLTQQGSPIIWVDIDLDEPGAAMAARAAANLHLGHSPFIRIGREPRQVRAYRSVEPVDSANLPGLELKTGERPELITVYGTHPGTGLPYLWPDQHLLDSTPEDLPVITRAGANAFLAEMERYTAPRPRVFGAPLKSQPAAHLLEAVADNPDTPPLALLASALAGAVEGWRRNSMFGCVVAAAMKGFSNQEIREALLPVFLAKHAQHEHRACEKAFRDALQWIRQRGYPDRAETEALRARCGWMRR